MKTLLRFGWRELWQSKGRAALVALILCVQAAALGGGFIAFDSLMFTRDHYYEQLHVADLDVQFVAASPTEIPKLDELRKISGVRDVSMRFVAPGYIEKKDGSPFPVVVHYLDPAAHPAVNDLEIQTGHYLVPGQPAEALIDRSYAAFSGLHVGDTVVVNPQSFATTFRISGIALSPEYLVPTSNPDLMISNKGSLGIIYASREQLDKLFAEPLYNDLVFLYEPGVDVRKTTDLVMASLRGLDVERVVPKTSNFGYRYVDSNLGGSRVFMPFTALLLGFMASIVAFVSVNRLVVNRRREIGGLLAQGFSGRQFIVGFLVLGFVPGLIGGFFGAFGSIAFGWHLADTSATIAGLPPPIMVIAAKWPILGAVSSVVVGLLSALVPSLSVLRLRPAHALRGGDEIRFSGLPKIVERLVSGTVGARYAMRNIFRRLRLSAAAALLVALATGMPAGLRTGLNSWSSWVKNQAAVTRWDAITTFKVPIDATHVARVMSARGVGDYETYFQGYAVSDGVEMRVRGLPVPSNLVTLDMKEGTGFSSADAHEVIVCNAFALGRHVPAIGETVKVSYRGVNTDLRVVGIVKDASMATLFVPVGTAQSIFGQTGKVSGAYLTFGEPSSPRAPLADDLPPPAARPDFAEVIDGVEDTKPAPVVTPVVHGTDPMGMKSTLLENDIVASVQLRNELTDAALRHFASFNGIIVPFIVLGGLLAFFFLLSVLGLVLLERETEYATLRTMGYGSREIARMVLTEVGVLTIAGLVCSIGSWVIIAVLLRDLMAKSWLEIPVDFQSADYALVALPTLVFVLVAAIPGIRSLMRLNLASVLRGRAMG